MNRLKNITLSLTIIIQLMLVSCTVEQDNTVSIRFHRGASKQALSNTIVSIYDGFNKSLGHFGSPGEHENSSYHLKDMYTNEEGVIELNLSKFSNRTILFEASDSFKYIQIKEDIVDVPYYLKEGSSYHIVSHYRYDFIKNILTIEKIESDDVQRLKSTTISSEKYSIIDIPLDEK